MKAAGNFLIKPTVLVHCSNEMTAVERRILNVLLQKARPKINSEPVHTIYVNELIDELGHGKYSNVEFLKESLLRLVDNSVRLNILGKDKRTKIESAISLLSSVTIVQGCVYYAFTGEVTGVLSKPAIYASINLDMQKRMSSKHSLALWEFCSEQLDSSKRDNIVSEEIELPKLRELLGAQKTLYEDFRYFKRDILTKAIKEVIEVSGISIEPQFIKEGKWIRKIRFVISRPIICDQDKQIQIYGMSENIVELVTKDLAEKNLRYDALELGLTEKDIDNFSKRFDIKEIRSALEFVNKKVEEKAKIRNMVAYLWTILENGVPEESCVQDKRTISLFAEKVRGVEAIGNARAKKFFVLLEQYFERDVCDGWLSHLDFEDEYDSKVIFSVHSDFIKEWLISNYQKKLLIVWNSISPDTETLEIIVKKKVKVA